jgi:hypothetical protein
LDACLARVEVGKTGPTRFIFDSFSFEQNFNSAVLGLVQSLLLGRFVR